MPARELTNAEITDAQLERIQEPEQRPEERRQPFFIVQIADVHIAIDAKHVEAVLDDIGCSPVPAAPAHVPGVITHRDHILALLDLAIFCQLPRRREGAQPRTVVIASGPLRAGVRCVAAAGVVEIAQGALRPPTVLAGGALVSFLVGECETPFGLCGVLDVPALLEAARVRV